VHDFKCAKHCAQEFGVSRIGTRERNTDRHQRQVGQAKAGEEGREGKVVRGGREGREGKEAMEGKEEGKSFCPSVKVGHTRKILPQHQP
jgi:hypothetical protein